MAGIQLKLCSSTAKARLGVGLFHRTTRSVALTPEGETLLPIAVRLLADWTPPRARFSLYYPDRRNPSAGFSAFLAMVRDAGRA